MSRGDNSEAELLLAEPGEEGPRCGVSELAPPDLCDPLLECYKRAVDRSLLIENLRLTPAQRAEKLQDFVRFLEGMRQAGRRLNGPRE